MRDEYLRKADEFLTYLDSQGVVLKVDKKTLLRRITEDPLLAVNLLQVMSHRIRDLNELVSHYRSASG